MWTPRKWLEDYFGKFAEPAVWAYDHSGHRYRVGVGKTEAHPVYWVKDGEQCGCYYVEATPGNFVRTDVPIE